MPSSHPPRLLALAGVAVLVVVACGKFEFPAGTCRASLMNARTDPEAATCTDCLELSSSCDDVGRCEDENGCTAAVRSAHECILRAGPLAARDEEACLEDAGVVPATNAARAYDTMRTRCGTECLLPVCQVDRAAQLVVNAACDKCVTGACCERMNECYGNRTCKLMFECIETRCADRLFERAGAAPGDPCVDEVPPVDAGRDCVFACIAEFSEHTQRRREERTKSPECLAFRIQQCAAAAGCVGACSPTPASASDASPPDDASADGGR